MKIMCPDCGKQMEAKKKAEREHPFHSFTYFECPTCKPKPKEAFIWSKEKCVFLGNSKLYKG